MDKSLIRMTLYNNTFRGKNVCIYVAIVTACYQQKIMSCGRYDTPIITLIHKRIEEISTYNHKLHYYYYYYYCYYDTDCTKMLGFIVIIMIKCYYYSNNC